jgi:DNA polymerase, archaea type
MGDARVTGETGPRVGDDDRSGEEPALASGGSLTAAEDEWLWGWDPTPGIVSVWAEPEGRAVVWRRIVETGELVREDARYRPWLLLDRLDDLVHLGPRLGVEGDPGALV